MSRQKGSKNKPKNGMEITDEDTGKSGRKARTGLPQINMIDAIGYVKRAYKAIGTNLKSFGGMAKAMDMKEGYAIKAFGELKDYGLLIQEEAGWKISDLGRRVSADDKGAVIEVLEKNDILSTLYKELKDKTYDKDYVEDFVRKKRFKYNINVSLVADRFLLATAYIKNLVGKSEETTEKEQDSKINPLLIKMIKLNYALFPPKPAGIKKLVEELASESENINDVTIKSFINKMSDKKDNEAELKTLMELLVEIVSSKYPSFSLEGNEESEDSD